MEPMRDFLLYSYIAVKTRCVCTTLWESYICHHLGKQVSHMEPGSALMMAWLGKWMSLQGLDHNQLEVSIFMGSRL